METVLLFFTVILLVVNAFWVLSLDKDIKELSKRLYDIEGRYWFKRNPVTGIHEYYDGGDHEV
jgi:hypothetical protein